LLRRRELTGSVGTDFYYDIDTFDICINGRVLLLYEADSGPIIDSKFLNKLYCFIFLLDAMSRNATLGTKTLIYFFEVLFKIRSLNEFCFFCGSFGVDTFKVFLKLIFILNRSYSIFNVVLFFCFDFLKDFREDFLIP
jgi:hypothetical protein